LGSRSIISQVATTNQTYVAEDVSSDPYYLPFAGLPETQSEVVVPLSAGTELLGFLDVQSDQPNAFESTDVSTLETLASQIVSALRNIRILETTRTDLQATSALYQASNKIAEAESPMMVLEALADTLKQTPFVSALFDVEVDYLYGVSIFDPAGQGEYPSPEHIDVDIEQLAADFDQPVTMTQDDERIAKVPEELLELLKKLRCQAFSLFPIKPGGNLEALLILGSQSIDRLTVSNLQPYHSLVEITRTALEKVKALGTIQQRLIELRSINAVSQSIASETDIDALYRLLDRHINQVMGEVNFLIARYSKENNTIEIPYMNDGSKITSVPPFPLGQGLSSIVIRTRQPLMLVEDTVRRSRALGAIITETGAAKSWLGVPLLIHDEPIGVLVVQDLEHEHRFNENDLQLLTTLASQVAIAVRNAYLLESSQQQAERERQLFDVTTKIRHAPDIQSVLRTTAEEISTLLGASRTRISIAEEFNPQSQAKYGDEEKRA
jgi:GAF domain-containing protein